MKQDSIQLHDIQPIMQVDEYSFYFLLAYSVLAMAFIAGLVYTLYFIYKKRKEVNQRKEYKVILESLNLDDTKKTAYMLTSYGVLFKDDSPQHQEAYESIVKRLSAYKYKKSVEAFDTETLEYIKTYRGMLSV